MTKQLELKQISNEEIDTRLGNYARNFIPEDMVQIIRIISFQLQDDQQVLDNVKQAIFDEIDKALDTYLYGDGLMTSFLDKVQALKKKWLK